jgi:uncharacterized repeat protein (TIGR03803 family)
MSSALLRSWLRSLARSWPRRPTARTSKSRRPRRAPLELWQLEERCLPSTLTTLATFGSGSGTFPAGQLLEDSQGNFFGTTTNGGPNSVGTVFELVHGTNTITTLAAFTGSPGNGGYPESNVIEDSNGNLFGTANFGGANNDGTVWELAADSMSSTGYSSTITDLADFSTTTGVNPFGHIVADASGDIFGTTFGGGVNNDGTVWELAASSSSPTGYSSTITDLADFSTATGAEPYGGLAMDAHGNLLGTTNLGGANNGGTVFELAAMISNNITAYSNTITDLADFSTTSGQNSYSGVVIDSSGNLFGATDSAGANTNGTIFELAASNSSSTGYSSTPTDLADFNNATTGSFAFGGLTVDSNGDLFGTADSGGSGGNGTIFELPHGSNSIMVLVSFTGTNGGNPEGGVIEDSNGNFFGTANTGGANNDGTVFEVSQGPSITSQPVNANATVGQSGSENFAVTASGTGTLTYQWEISTNGGQSFSNLTDGPGVSGSSTATLTLSGFATAASAEYQVIVTDSNGQATSTPATLTVNAAPSITTQPVSAAATVGQSAGSETFTVAATGGSGTLSVQWQFSTNGGQSFSNLTDGNGISGSSTTTLTVSSLSSPGTTEYQAVVTDANDVTATSNAATLTINAAPSVATQPASFVATMGQSGPASFSVVVAFGTSPFTYQWQLSTDGGNTFSIVSNGSGISGATTDALTVNSNALPASGTEYRVLITDANGVMVTSADATLSIVAAPSITTQPQNAIATAGESASRSFSIAASGGNTPYTVQWQFSTDNGQTFSNLSNGSGISGATGMTLTVSSFAAASSLQYRAIVTDSNGVTATSNPASLTINAAPAFTAQPGNAIATVSQSGSETFSFTAGGGTGSLSVQWQFSTDNGQTFSNLSNGNGVFGATGTTLIISSFPTAGSVEYRAVVTDANDVSVPSQAAVLTVNAAPTITTQPANEAATVGQTSPESFSVVAANGTSPFAYQWQDSTDGGNNFSNVTDGSGISGANAATLSISSTALPAPGTEYRVVITDANEVAVVSTVATFTVNAAPAITTQPQNLTATAGQSASASFTVAASGGSGTLSVQWQISTDGGSTFTNLSDGSGVTGSTTPTLIISSLASSGSVEYQAIITDVNHVSVTSNPATLAINTPPIITTQPQSATATVGQSTSESFTIADSGGTAPLSVQWQVSTDGGSTFTNLSDGNGVSGSTTATLTINSFATSGSAEYQAVVSDANGVSVTSKAATLTINASTNPADPNQNWLTQVYADFFHRPLDPSGLATWEGLLNQGFSRTQVAQFIQQGLEYRTDVVEALYSKLLHREADSAGLDGFTTFLGGGGTAAQVEAAIMGSAEYFQLHGGTTDGFLNGVYQDAFNRALDSSGAQTWSSLLAGGSTQQAVAGAILASLEAQTDAVQSYFTQYLNRSADPSGLNGFTTALQQGVSTDMVIASIVGSEEFFNLAQ